MVVPALIGAGASLLGGLFGSSGKKREIAAQREFAQQGVRWKVADAKAAGIHPLAALGAQTHQYSPVGLGEPMQTAMEGVGQNISRAVQAKQTNRERSLALTAANLDIERKQLENQHLRTQLLGSQIAVTRQAGQPPSMPTAAGSPIPGQGDTNLVEMLPMEVVRSDPQKDYQEPAQINELGFTRTPTGGYAPVPSEQAKERLEEMIVPTIGWNMRNIVPQLFQQNLSPPYPAPEGSYWAFNPFRMEYELRKGKPFLDVRSFAKPKYRTHGGF